MLLPTFSVLLLPLFPFLAVSVFRPVCAPHSFPPLPILDCLTIRNDIAISPYAYRNITWSEDEPGHYGNLPMRWIHETCQVKLALLWPGSGTWVRFEPIELVNLINAIVVECVVGGPQRGGGGSFGTNAQVEDVMVVSVMGITGHVAVDKTDVDNTKGIGDLSFLDATDASVVT